jgi:hypothetical protein
MDTELAALAATGATTLVSLMVTDSWAHARALVGRFFSRSGADSTAITDLDASRTQLLGAAVPEDTTRELTELWHACMYDLMQTGHASGSELRDLLTSLQRLAKDLEIQPINVHNDIRGGAQHGPVIQAGKVTGLTFHAHHPVTLAEE